MGYELLFEVLWKMSWDLRWNEWKLKKKKIQREEGILLSLSVSWVVCIEIC
jgi:hypothetical protein